VVPPFYLRGKNIIRHGAIRDAERGLPSGAENEKARKEVPAVSPVITKKRGLDSHRRRREGLKR